MKTLAQAAAVAMMMAVGTTAGAAFAQTEPAAPVAPDPRTVDQFVEAVQDVVPIQEQAQQQIQQAQTEDEAQAIVAEAEQAAIAAIQGRGLTVDQYNEMSFLMQADESFRDDVLARLGVEIR